MYREREGLVLTGHRSHRRRPRLAGWLLGAAALFAAAGCLMVGAGAAVAEMIPVPSGAATGASAQVSLAATSCQETGACVAVGFYEDNTSAFRGLIETEANGVWTAIKAPTTGLGDQFSSLNAISCPSAGNCAAVGGYTDASGNDQGLIETETNGVWTGIKAPLTGLATLSNPHVDIFSVSCSTAGNCAAVGAYADPGGHEEGLIETETNGVWTTTSANVSALGGSSTPAVQLNSVSCAAPGSCVAVGNFVDSSSHQQGLIVSDSGGTWTASKPNLSSLPSTATNPNVGLTAVSCPAAGDCTAVGRYIDGSSTDGSWQLLLLSSTGSVWSAPTKATLPADADLGETGHTAESDLRLESISCTSPGTCMAVGSYDATASKAMEALTLSQQAGAWSAGVEQSPDAVTGAANPFGQLNSVSCYAAGVCKAVGFYELSSGVTDSWVLSTSGSSSASAAFPVLSGAAVAGISAVSCSSTGYCATTGWLGNSTATVPFLLDAPAATGSPAAAVSGTNAQISWSAPADTGGLPISGYTVVATDATTPSHGGQSLTVAGSSTSATIGGLTPGDTYTFTVTPASLLGNGLTATTPAVQVPLAIQQVSISTQQLTASLVGLLAPHGPAARLKRLRKTHGYTFVYRPLESGTVSVRWYETTGRGKHRHRHLVASGSAPTTATTPVDVHVRLTKFGRAAVKSLHRLKLTAIVTFVSGSVRVSSKHTFTLH